MEHIKPSVARDFRINSAVVRAALEEQGSPSSSDSEEEEEGNNEPEKEKENGDEEEMEEDEDKVRSYDIFGWNICIVVTTFSHYFWLVLL